MDTRNSKTGNAAYYRMIFTQARCKTIKEQKWYENHKTGRYYIPFNSLDVLVNILIFFAEHESFNTVTELWNLLGITKKDRFLVEFIVLTTN